MRPTLRTAIAAIVLVLAGFGIVAATSSWVGAETSLDGTSATIVGTWKVNYGAPAIVGIKSMGTDSYSMTAKTPVTVTGGSSCSLPVGTVIATFSGRGPTYAGRHGLWNRNDCRFVSWTHLAITLKGETLVATLGNGEHHTLSSLAAAAGNNGAVPSQLVKSILTPSQVSFSPKLLRDNALLALLFVFLVALPSTIFNSTLTANYERVTRGFRRVRRAFGGVESVTNHLPGGVVLVGFGIVGGLIYGLLDPGFGYNQTTLVLVGALAGSLIIVTGIFELLRVRYLRRRHHRRARLVGYPLALLIAVMLVAFSRLGHIQPGYIFGFTCALVYLDPVAEHEEGRSLMVAALTLLVISLAAWFIWIPVHNGASGAHPGVASVFFDALLATTWIAGLQSIIFGLLPMRFLYGEKFAGWSWTRWLAVYGVAMFIFVHVLVQPSSGHYGGSPDASLGSMLLPFLVFTVAAVGFWAWFRFGNLRRRRPALANSDDARQSTVRP